MPPRAEATRVASGAYVVPDAPAVLRAIEAEWGIRLSAFTPVVGGWDTAASVWFGTDSDGRLWGVKSTTRDVAFGLRVASSVADAGIPGVVAPLRARDGRPWIDVDGVAVIVTPWVDGVDAVDVGSDAVDWEQLGRTLRAVHDQPPPPDVSARRRGIRRVPEPPRALIDAISERLEDDPRHDDRIDDLRRRWADVRPRLLSLAAAERELKRERTPASRVTVHGDPHLGNVVLDASGRPWLVDFDESAVAPREVDLMLIELGVLFSVPIADVHRERFRDGYGRDAVIDERRIVRFGCVRAIEDVTATFGLALGDDTRVMDVPLALDGILGPRGLIALVEDELARLSPTRTSPAPRTFPPEKDTP